MPAREKREEIQRLQKLFEAEAAQFHDLTLSILYLTQLSANSGRELKKPNHLVTLWQYYGLLDGETAANQLFANLYTSDLSMGAVRGSEFSCLALVEGARAPEFVRMANRAGNIFTEKEAHRIRARSQRDFESNHSAGKPVFVSNSSKIAIWLNHVLHHLGKTHPGHLLEATVRVDPFVASLSAIDKLLTRKSLVRDRLSGTRGVESIKFKVGLSFPGEQRSYAEQVATCLTRELGENAIFYDKYYQAELARPNLDLLLQKVYREQCKLVVVFLCGEYAIKEWCGLEWRAIRDIIKLRKDRDVMFIRFDDAPVPGVFSIDGYIDANFSSPSNTAQAIVDRVKAASG